MISKHSTIIKSYTRNLPLIGWGFLYIQSKRHLKMAKEDDEAFLSAMREMGKEPDERLLSQNVRLEYRLIIASFITITIAWVVSFLLLNHINYIYVFILAACNAYCLEWLILECVTRVSFRVSNGKS